MSRRAGRTKTGLFVPLGDAPALAGVISRVIGVWGLAGRLAEAGWRCYRAEVTEAACVARYLQLFQKLLAARAGGEGAGTG